ncbi:MAG: hypothetical protein HC875_29385 [Anaerolineales bacterium]|nr:hypothetical protein [Anaerolineales bacterium]
MSLNNEPGPSSESAPQQFPAPGASIGSVNFADISGGQIEIGDIRVDIKAEADIVGGNKLVQNITQIQKRALTAAEEAAQSRSLALQQLAAGVSDYAQRLSALAVGDADAGNPYKGLLAYRLGDARLFYGRDNTIRDLLRIIHRHPLTVLHSESGSGKSSLLQAGLMPHLLADEKPHLPVYLRPYNVRPDLAIKREFLPILGQPTSTSIESNQVYRYLADAPLQEFLRQVTGVLGPNGTVYLLLDQFEELFTMLDQADQTTFVSELAACLNDETLSVRWVLALRSEFLVTWPIFARKLNILLKMNTASTG